MLNNVTKRWATLTALALVLCATSVFAVRSKVVDISLDGANLFNKEVLSDGTVRITSDIPRRLGVSSTNVLGEWYAGYSSAGDLLDMSGNLRNLADTLAPPVVDSDILGPDRNALQAFSYNGSSQFHSLAHDAWMNVFDGDNTVAMLLRSPAAAGTQLGLFSHGAYNSSGVAYYITVTGSFGAAYYKSGSGVLPAAASTLADGSYHLVHVVRSGNYVTVYVDGVAGAPVDVVTGGPYGIDGSAALQIGWTGGTSYMNGPIAYTRLQNTALTFSQIQRENDLFKGLLASQSAQKYASPTFIRSTTSYVNKSTGTTSMHKVPANWPAKTSDGAVLIEGAVENLVINSNTFTSWNVSKVSIPATSVVLPDGSTGTVNTIRSTSDVGDPQQHTITSTTATVTNATKYTASVYMKAAGKTWVQFQVYDGTTAFAAYVNTATGVMGTVSGAGATASSKPEKNGWFRFWLTFTTTNTSAVLYVKCADSDGDITVTGTDADDYYIFGAQLQLGAFPTTYYPTTTTKLTRSADSLTYIPWRISKNLARHVNATPRLQFLGSESLNGTTVTPTIGAYSFTKNGRPQNNSNEEEGANFRFNGSTDYLSLASADFNPGASSFTVVTSWTPLSSSAAQYVVSKSGAAGNRGWILWQNGSSVVFTRTVDGTALLSATVSNCIEVGKPLMATAVFDPSVGIKLYVDGYATASEATLGNTYTSSVDFAIGFGGGGNYLNGKIHYHGYYHGYAASETEHDNAYAAFKLDGVLPLTMSATTPKTKLIIEFEAKAQYSSAADIGQTRTLVEISGSTGTADSDTNRITIRARTADGKAYLGVFCANESTERYAMTVAGQTDYNQWAKYTATIDFADLANSTAYKGTTALVLNASMTGIDKSISFLDTTIRVGQIYGGSATSGNAHAEIRNVKIYTR